MRGLLRIAGVAVVAVLALVRPAAAHPLGNFTVNHLSRITTERGTLHVRYVLDLAEIPAFTLDRSLDAHGTPSQPTLDGWAAAHAKDVAPQLALSIDGRAVALTPIASSVRPRPGAGGLPTLYFTATYTAPLGAGAHRIAYRDDTEPGRLGWKDVVAGTAHEPTDELRSYPSALVGSPRARTALAAVIDPAGTLAVDAGASAAIADAPPPSAPLARSNALSDVLAKGASDPLILLGALLLAVGLGALHALEPGHGKTLLAVSLVGARATAGQAFILAGALTAAHTAAVFAFGIVLLYLGHWIIPEQIYPWIAIGTGIVITVFGARAVAREVRKRLPFAHEHPHAHPRAQPHAHDHLHAPGEHHHHYHDDAHAHGDHHHDEHAEHGHDDLDDLAHARAHAIPGTAPLTFRTAVVAAVAGNLAPCPAAIVVLLAALNAHRVGYGMVLIVAFSIGLAAVLTGLGIAVVRGASWLVTQPRFDKIARFAPLVTAVVFATVGAVMIGRGFADAGAGVPVPLTVALVLAAVGGYAFAWHQHLPRREVAA